MDRRRKIVTNPYEAETHRILKETASQYGAEVYSKVRIADVLDVRGSGISNEQYSYALKGHFDFTVTDQNSQALFAVEFDGLHHDTDTDALRRDALKNAICEQLGFPLLRIGDQFFRKVGRFTLLGWLTEVWFLNDAFMQAQEDGHVPFDEVFNYSFFLGTAYRDKGRIVEIDHLELSEQLRLMRQHEGRIVITQPYDPFVPSRVYIKRAFNSGACRKPIPEEFVGTDPAGYQIALAALPVGDDRFVLGHARVRSYRFAPVPSEELAIELSTVDAANKLMQYREGAYVGSTASEFGAWRSRMKRWWDVR